MGDNKPVKTFREGNITVNVWKNNTKDEGVFYNITTNRSYKDKNDEWQHTNSYSGREACVLSSLLLQAHSYLGGLSE